MRSLACVLVGFVACGDSTPAKTPYFELDRPTSDPATFWNLPLPSDLRLDARGAPDLAGFPDKHHAAIVDSLLSAVPLRQGWPVMSGAYIRFTAPVPPHAITDVIGDGSIVLVDIDPASPELGREQPLVVQTLAADDYAASDLVAIAPRPGVVLRPLTRYAYVVRTAFAPGFKPAPAFADLAAGHAPAGPRGAAAVALYAPLWPALATAGIPRGDVLVATVFTTGDEVARTQRRSDAIRAAYHPAIDNLQLVGGTSYDGFCRLSGTITMPQFQVGAPPFDTGGGFVLDGSDVPVRQTDMTIPLSITLPRGAMPATGWPLYQFFHGSGGLSTGVVDLGRSADASDRPEPGKGPGYVVARHGIAAASAALPLNPERLSGATDYEYLNLDNLAAFPQTFQQGVFEQRLLLDALISLRIPQALVAGCTGITAPGGSHFFDPAKLTAGGQSMGGMYTNIIGAVEPRYGALVPTGAGGFWNLMVLETRAIPGARTLLSAMLRVDDGALTFVHPALYLFALAWEAGEPFASMARLGQRNIYQPVGRGDMFFPLDLYEAAAAAYGNPHAGTSELPYPVKGNAAGKTRVAIRFDGDGIVDPHYIYRQLDGVKHQYGCFLASYLRDGVPTVPAPGGLTDPCP